MNTLNLAFSRFLDLRGNLGVDKEKQTRKTCFEKKRLASRINLAKFLLGGMSAKFLLYFHEK